MLPSGRKLRAAAVDGTCWGRQYAGAVEVLGKPSVVIDFERCHGKGHELSASQAVMRRSVESFGKGFVDIFLGDGLYITQEMLRLCRDELGTHLLVKTGVDLVRGLRYEIWAARGFHHTGFEGELKVARVVTEPLKGKKGRETFWIITTDLDLSARMMLLSFILVVAYHAELEEEKLFQKCRVRRLTLKQLVEYWLMST